MILQDIKLITDTLHIWRVALEFPTKFVVQIYTDLLQVSFSVLEIILTKRFRSRLRSILKLQIQVYLNTLK